VFDNEGEEREAFVKYVLAQAEMALERFSAEQHEDFLHLTADYYPADFDQLLTQLKRRRRVEGDLTPEMVIEEVNDFIPSDVARQREYQELLAVLECTSRELLPSRYARMSRDAIEKQVREIRAGMGEI
jgi:hypothetical protein